METRQREKVMREERERREESRPVDAERTQKKRRKRLIASGARKSC